MPPYFYLCIILYLLSFVKREFHKTKGRKNAALGYSLFLLAHFLFIKLRGGVEVSAKELVEQ